RPRHAGPVGHPGRRATDQPRLNRPDRCDVENWWRAGARAGPPFPHHFFLPSRLTLSRPLGLFLFLLLAIVVGCQQGDKQNYANVSGTVTYNGQPIDKGQIIFAMEGRPPSTMDIVEGKFAGQAMVGSNKVSVSARKKAASAPKLSKAAETQ